jgi:hypothetical protein
MRQIFDPDINKVSHLICLPMRGCTSELKSGKLLHRASQHHGFQAKFLYNYTQKPQILLSKYLIWSATQ